ncbi:TetR/AcrR family transcriptional regulator [Dermabacteraceae bacterium P13128]
MMAVSRDLSARAGLTPEAVIDAALELTRERHLYGWSIRDLAKRLGVAPSVIYHHVGGKDLLARRVVGRVIPQIAMPDLSFAWKEWFRALLISGRDVMREYPGVAKWVMLHGPMFPDSLRTIDAGVEKLKDAGFGDNAIYAYSLILNNCVAALMVADERLLHEDDGPRDHATIRDEFLRNAETSRALGEMTERMVVPLAEGNEAAERVGNHYYGLVVETTIAGAELLLKQDKQDIL